MRHFDLRPCTAYHEPTLVQNLDQHFRNMVQLRAWLSPDAATWCRLHCRFVRFSLREGIGRHSAAVSLLRGYP
jgi:hypothetical protein